MSSYKVSFTPTHSREDLYNDVVVLKKTATGLKTVYQASKAIDKWCGLEEASKARSHSSTKGRYTTYQTSVTQNCKIIERAKKGEIVEAGKMKNAMQLLAQEQGGKKLLKKSLAEVCVLSIKAEKAELGKDVNLPELYDNMCEVFKSGHNGCKHHDKIEENLKSLGDLKNLCIELGLEAVEAYKKPGSSSPTISSARRNLNLELELSSDEDQDVADLASELCSSNIA